MTKGVGRKDKASGAIDYSLAVVVSDRVEIEDVRVIEAGCMQQPTASRGKHALEIDCRTIVKVDRASKHLLVFLHFTLQGFPAEDERAEPDLTVEARFLLVYKLTSVKGLKKENYEAFAESNGIYNAWPYWREYVQNTVVRMNLPPLTIPVFRLVKPAKEVQKMKARTGGARGAGKSKGKSGKKGKR
jgi:preprotein translocase subunit SecB